VSFEVVGSRELFPAGFLTLAERRVEGEGESFTRVVVEHPGAVVVVPVADDGRALLLRQFRAAIAGDLLEVPAGKRDVDGEPPEETARRELVEEIGFRPGRLVKLAEFFNSPGFCTEYSHVFVALELVDAGGRQAVDHEEAAMTVEPVAFDAIDTLIARRELVDAKSIIGLLLARQFLAGGYGGVRA
jgi:ADP-ribose pyrophosphatase